MSCNDGMYSDIGVLATYISLEGGQVKAFPRYITRVHLDTLYKFGRYLAPGYAVSGHAKVGELIIHALPLNQLVDMYGYFTSSQLRALASGHNISVPGRRNQLEMLGVLREHQCSESYLGFEYVFEMLSQVRKGVRTNGGDLSPNQERLRDQTEEAPPSDDTMNSPDDDSTSYLEIADAELRKAIIKEWEQVMSTAALAEWVCASCARCNPQSKITFMKLSNDKLALLRNDSLPERILPRSYNIWAYNGALLHPRGLTNLTARAELKICHECRRDLERHRMPKFALANWLYYGHDRLPEDVKVAFLEATQVERMLVSRARASKISFKFSELKGHDLEGTDPNTSQRCIKGNIAIHPQDATHLNAVLPPSNDVIRDMVCAVFVGKTKPTPETIERLRPALVRKSRVKAMINFLVKESGNVGYKESAAGFGGFSQANLDDLFGEGTRHIEEGVPCAIEIGHLEFNDAVEGATSNYVPGSEVRPCPGDTDMLMENVGYIAGDDTPIDHKALSMKALSHCLNGGSFIKSQAGSRFIPDFENPLLLTWLFPHLDPWGIGGFHDPRRSRVLSLDQQLKYLLTVCDSPFRDDPDFAFVYYNIRQKKAVFDSVTFRVPASRREKAVADLLSVNVERLDELIARFKGNPHYRPTDREEVRILKVLQSINTVSHDLPGSNGYKLSLRNQIRGLINFEGTPTLFVTLNPSDRDHPLVRLYAGHEINIEDRMRGEELSRWQRSIIAARNPSACARFFHTMISNFIKIILRYGRPGKGLFGKCKAYYGTVEAQGRGTLHCHMLIWLEGHPSPQKLREKMHSSESYRELMFQWLESVIKCELPNTQEVVTEPRGHPLTRPAVGDESGVFHPGAEAAPSIDAYQRHEEFQAAFDEFVSELVKAFNWHEHNGTCFKYVAKGAVPDDPERRDALCRMRIDGSTRLKTELDSDTGGILLRRLHPRIASYNDLVIFLMKCNMDIKFIGSGEAAKALLYYITDYITKASLPAYIGLGALSYAIKKVNEKFPTLEGETLPRGALNMTVNRMMSSQEVSHQQVMSYLVGGGDVYTSHVFRILHWGAFDRLFRNHFNEPRFSTSSETDIQFPSNEAEEQGSGEDREREACEDMEVDDGEGADEANIESDASSETEDSDSEAEFSEGDEEDQRDESFTIKLGRDGSISATNQQQDYVYRSNNPAFDSLCLYEFVGITDKVRKGGSYGQHAGHEESSDIEESELSGIGNRGRRAALRGAFSSPVHTQFETHVLRKRESWTVPVLLGERVPRSDRDPSEKEAWARMMLILFVPWRSPSDLRSMRESWTEAFERQRGRISSKHLKIIENMNVLSECRDVRDTYRDMRRKEALAFMREGFSGNGAVSHSGGDLEDLDDEYELFEKSGERNIYDSLDNVEVSCTSLDQIVGSQARQILDVCYGQQEVRRLFRGDVQTSVRQRQEDDGPMLMNHMAIMRHLKRQRRPESIEESNTRPSKRKKRHHEVHESVSIATIERERECAQSSGELPSSHEAIERIVADMRLSDNPEQDRAFRIVAEHATAQVNNDQLLMYIAGVGGTGKTHVVQAILRLFQLLGRSKEIMVGAPTGAAALNIGGYTVHSLMMLPCSKLKRVLPKLRELWSPVRYLVIDEVSMIGARFLADISRRLQLAKGDTGVAAINPFGGVNVIFTGDFGQLKPVEGPCLYSHEYINHPGLQAISSHVGMDKLKGIYLWRQVQTVVQLTKNQRQVADPQYGNLLNRVRIGQGRARPVEGTCEPSDVDLLSRRTLHQVSREDPASLLAFKEAPVIVGRKNIRDAINARIIQHKSRELGEKVINLYARDHIGGKPVSPTLQKALWTLSASKTQDALSTLPVFRGMKVMIRENIAFSRRLVNGAEGTVRSVVHETVDGVSYPTVVYVHVPGTGQICEGLDEDVVPVFPERTHFRCKLRVGTNEMVKSISRLQLPLLPAYSYTDYKSQGKTLTHAIVDLQSAKSLQGAYVMLSRVRTLQGLLLLRPFGASKVCGRLSQELRDELCRIERLAQATQARFDARHLPLSDFRGV